MMIRTAAIFILLFATATANRVESQEHMKHSVLAIEYAGPSDKPITPIVISDSKAGAEWYRSAVLERDELQLTYLHVVTVPLLGNLIADVESYRTTVQQEEEKRPKSSKTISVTTITPQTKNTVWYDLGSAVSLLESLQKRCKDDESLRSDLAHFQDRIRHREDLSLKGHGDTRLIS